MVHLSWCRIACPCTLRTTAILAGLMSLHLFAADAVGQTSPPSTVGPCRTTDLYHAPIVSVTGGDTSVRIFLNRQRATLEVPLRLADFCLHAVPVTRESWYAAAGNLPALTESSNSVEGSAVAPSPARQQLPVTGITQHEAAAYCASVGGRLPTEAEWEFAAAPHLDNHHRTDTPALPVDANGQPLANLGWDRDGYEQLAPVTAFRTGPFGLYDMIGNAAEWTASSEVFIFRPWHHLTSRQPGTDVAAVYKGGSFADNPDVSRRWQPRARAAAQPDQRLDDVGFRCAFDAARPAD